jgi:hypothetical protein
LQPDLAPAAIAQDENQFAADVVVAASTSAHAADSGTALFAKADPPLPAAEPRSSGEPTATTASGGRRNLVQKVRAWLRGNAAESA